jgi:hypothetical protein
MRVALAIALLAASGCHVGSGTGSLSGQLFVAECSNDPIAPYGTGTAGLQPYNMNPTFFVAEMTDDFMRATPMNKLAIRVQSGGNRVIEADVMFVNIASYDDLVSTLGQPVTVGPSTNVRASLILNQTCPAHQVQLELDGSIAFSKLGGATGGAAPGFHLNYGDELAASFAFDVVDRRAITLGGQGSVAPQATAAGHLTGNFDFQIVQSTIAQAHP